MMADKGREAFGGRYALSFVATLVVVLLCACFALCSCGPATNQIAAPASSPTATSPSPGGALTVRYLDVGQGDATLIGCDGHWMLIDGGPAEASQKLYATLKSLDVTHLDCIIATHPDADHIGGLAGALNYASCDACFCSTTSGDTRTFSNLVKYLDRSSGVGITIPDLGLSFKLGEATVTFLGPLYWYESDNDNSLVVRVEYGTTSFLFTGDAEEQSELDLAKSGSNLESDVLQVGHHGSSSSSMPAFLRKVNPTYAIVSVGENTYGHPTDKTLRSLDSVGATVLRTDECGDILFTSDGRSISYTVG